VFYFNDNGTIGLVKSAVLANIKAKTFHALTSNRTKLQKVTQRLLWAFYVHLMFTNKRKSTCEKLVSAWFSAWTSQGLNLGPPDY